MDTYRFIYIIYIWSNGQTRLSEYMPPPSIPFRADFATYTDSWPLLAPPGFSQLLASPVFFDICCICLTSAALVDLFIPPCPIPLQCRETNTRPQKLGAGNSRRLYYSMQRQLPDPPNRGRISQTCFDSQCQNNKLKANNQY